jgi:hypothetical protein
MRNGPNVIKLFFPGHTHKLNVILLRVILLNVILLNAILLNVILQRAILLIVEAPSQLNCVFQCYLETLDIHYNISNFGNFKLKRRRMA